MKSSERIMMVLSIFIFILMSIIGFIKIENELESTIKENIELKQQIDDLEKENHKLNFEKSLERTCGLQSVQCDDE